jgi:SHS2 domain-containing protein
MRYKFLEHTADIKFQAFGSSLEEAFSNSALAMKEAMCKEKIKGMIRKKIKVKGKDNGSLLYNFLEELLFLLDTENFIISRVEKIKINKNDINAEIIGDNARNYEFDLDVKAVTYNSMFVKKLNQGSATPIKWVVQVVLDV